MRKKEGVKIRPANVGMMAKKSFLQEKPETGESDSLEADVKALMKMRRMLELYHQQGMCGAVKELTEEIEKEGEKLAMMMQKRMSKRGKASSSSAMEEETWDRVSLPGDQPSMPSQSAWSRVVRELLSREMMINLAWKGYHPKAVPSQGPMSEQGQGAWM